jgi:hypothetical protein
MKNQNEDVSKKVKSILFTLAISIAFNIYAVRKTTEKVKSMQEDIDQLVFENGLLREELFHCPK